MNNQLILSASMCGLCGIGGLMGYLKKGSKMSLIAGGSVAIGFGSLAYTINANLAQNIQPPRPNYAGIVLSVLLFVGMGMRAKKVASQNNGQIPTIPAATAAAGLVSAILFGVL